MQVVVNPTIIRSRPRRPIVGTEYHLDDAKLIFIEINSVFIIMFPVWRFELFKTLTEVNEGV